MYHSGPQDDLSWYTEQSEYWRAQATKMQQEKWAEMRSSDGLRAEIARLQEEIERLEGLVFKVVSL